MVDPDEDIEAMLENAWHDLPQHYRRQVLRRAKSDLWWEEALFKLKRRQTAFVLVVSVLGTLSIFRENISEFAQWLADVTQRDER